MIISLAIFSCMFLGESAWAYILMNNSCETEVIKILGVDTEATKCNDEDSIVSALIYQSVFYTFAELLPIFFSLYTHRHNFKKMDEELKRREDMKCISKVLGGGYKK